MARIIKWFEREAVLLVPAVIYFLICFNLFHFAQSLMMQPADIRYTSYLGATFGAILAGKVILIVDSLPFIDAFPNEPIIYNITWKLFIYSFFVLLVQIIDHMTRKIYHTKSWSIAFTNLKTDLATPMFWGIQILVLMFFLVFIVFSEVTNIIGRSKMKKIFFG